MKKKAVTHKSRTTRQSSLNFQTHSIANNKLPEISAQAEPLAENPKIGSPLDLIPQPIDKQERMHEDSCRTIENEPGETLLTRILIERRLNWQGRGPYREPNAPDLTKLPILAEGWKWATVEQLGQATTGFTPPKNDSSFFGGSIPFFKPSDLDVGYYVRDYRDSLTDAGAEHGRILPPLSILVTCIGATIGKTGLTRVRCATNQQINALTVPTHLVSPQFVYWYFNSQFAQRQIIDNASATTLPILNKTRFESLPVPLPSIAEQHGIVAEIEKQFTRLDAGVAALKRVQANLKRYRAAVLKAACEGKLVPTEAELARQEGRTYETGEQLLQRILTERRKNWQGRGSYKEPTEPDTANLPEIPVGWKWATLEQLCSLFADSAHRTPKYGDTGVPALGPRDVVGGKLDLEGARLVNEVEFAVQTARHVPQAGDIVYSRELSLGWGALIPVGRRICLSQGMCIFRPHQDVDTRYFLALLNGPVGRKHAEAAATGSAHPHINLGDIKGYVFPLPPLAEQIRIVAEVERRLSVVEELEAVVSANLQRATRLRLSILQKAFTGELNT